MKSIEFCRSWETDRHSVGHETPFHERFQKSTTFDPILSQMSPLRTRHSSFLYDQF
jgi:hypothetical protein